MSSLAIETPEWAVDLLQPARYKAVFGGRGSTKSHTFGENLIEEHVINPNQKSVCIREVQKTLDHSVKALLEQKIQKFNVGDAFDVQRGIIKNNYGDGIIIFQGMQDHTADSIKSLEGFDRAWVEEAQSLSQRSLDLLRPTIRKGGSEIWFSWNPYLPTDPVDNFFRSEAPPEGTVLINVNYDANPWFNETSLVQEMEYDKRRDYDKYRHVWLGEYVQNSEARVFKNWKVEEFNTPKDAEFKFGADWGFASDPTVLIRLYFEGRTIFVDYEAYQVGCEIINTPDLFLSVPESEKYAIIADSARPETISHMQKHGFPRIMGAIKGPKSVEEGVEWLKSYDIVVHPRCEHLIDELTHYSYKRDKLTEEVLPILEDKHNHVIDALRYACENSRRVSVASGVEFEMPDMSGGWMS